MALDNPLDPGGGGDEGGGGGYFPGTGPNRSGGGPCPPGMSRHPTRGDCRYDGDMPCPSGLCKDTATGQCRTFNPNREKVNETDTTERDTGGGRGYCRQRDGGGGGGGLGRGGAAGGAGGAGTGGFGTGTFGISDPNQRFDDLHKHIEGKFQSIWDELLPVAQGKETRYNDQTMGYLTGQARVDRAGNIAAGTEDVYNDAITRGVGRSGVTSGAVADVVRGANQEYSRQVTAMRVKKVEQDFEDRMSALDRMRTALQDHQQYILGLDANAADREKAIANIALGYARIAAEERMLRSQLNVQLQIANTGFDIDRERNATNILLNARPV